MRHIFFAIYFPFLEFFSKNHFLVKKQIDSNFLNRELYWKKKLQNKILGKYFNIC